MPVKQRYGQNVAFGQIEQTIFKEAFIYSVSGVGSWSTAKTITIQPSQLKTIDTECRSLSITWHAASGSAASSDNRTRCQINGVTVQEELFLVQGAAAPNNEYIVTYPVTNLNLPLTITIQIEPWAAGNFNVTGPIEVSGRFVVLER